MKKLLFVFFFLSALFFILNSSSVHAAPQAFETQFEVSDNVNIPCVEKTVTTTDPDTNETTTQTIEDCSPRVETHSLKGNLGLPDTNLPYIRQMADWLEGTYYDEEKLQEAVKNGAPTPELFGPIDKLLPKKVQEKLRRDLIRKIQNSEFTPGYDIKIKATDYYQEKTLAEISLLKDIDLPPAETASEKIFNQWRMENFPVFCLQQGKEAQPITTEEEKGQCLNLNGRVEDSFLKVPMAPRGDLTVKGSLAFTNPPDCSKTQGEVTNCAISPAISENQLSTSNKHLTLDVPQLIRLRELTKNLWQFLTAPAIQQKYILEDKLQMGQRPTFDDDQIKVSGNKPSLDVTANFTGPGTFKIGADVVALYTIPYLTDVSRFTIGPTGIFATAYRPSVWPFTDAGFIPPESFKFEPEQNFLGKIAGFFQSIFQLPYVEGIQKGAEFVQAALWPNTAR